MYLLVLSYLFAQKLSRRHEYHLQQISTQFLPAATGPVYCTRRKLTTATRTTININHILLECRLIYKCKIEAYKNISSFDFFDTSGRVERSLGDLQNNFLSMEQQFSEGFYFFTKSLGKGLISGEDAAPFGTDYTETPGTPGTDGKLQPIHKQALDC